MFEGLAYILDMPFLSKLLHPGHPLLHHLLHFLRGSPALGTAIKIYKLVHDNSSLVCFLILERLKSTATDIFLLRSSSEPAGNTVLATGAREARRDVRTPALWRPRMTIGGV